MPLSNLNNQHFTDQVMEEMLKAWDVILNHLNNYTRNLSPEERTKYGSISEENKLVAQKVMEYERNQPHLKSPDVDYDEFYADWQDRQFLAGFVNKMLEATNICNNIRITHDYDVFQSAMLDYKYTKYKMETAPGAGYEQKFKDLLYFFKGGRPPEDNENDAPETGSPKPAV